MFKSVFAKYITAFMTLIIVSFTILAVILSTMMQTYAHSDMQETLSRGANNIRTYLEMGYRVSEYDSYDDYISDNESQIVRTISTLGSLADDSLVIITDVKGNILISTGELKDSELPLSVYQRVITDNYFEPEGNIGGLVDGKYSLYAMQVTDDNGLVGTILSCASSDSINAFVTDMVKAIIMSCLWLMLATLIAVYFITEKIIGPIREMSKASKSFASGHFDVRVPVIGQDEVAGLATAFNNMASSLENYEETRRTFLANVSHDLRSPMFTIGGYIDGILAGAIPPEEQNEKLEIIAVEVRRLSRLVASLLDISRIQAGDRKFTMIPFDICEMGRQILISFEQRLVEKKLDVDYDCENERLFVLADYDAIYQIFYNICDNAIKFSREGGKYRINIKVKDKKALVSVFNEGNGIAQNDIPHIFDRFYKADKSRGLDKMGTGLGLYIAKTITDAHNEKIWVESVEGENCCFSFTLKLSSEQAYKQYTEEQRSKEAAKNSNQ